MQLKHTLKQKLAWLVAATTLGTTHASTTGDAKNSIATLVKRNTAFAVELYQREAAGADNLFFSPYSISTALAMTWAGARGQTEQESLGILLPKAVDGLTALERQLSADRLQKWLAALDGAPESGAVVHLPRFKLNCRLELAKELAAMGMPSAFAPPDADFSGMTGKHDLFIADIVHQAFVEVNEEGTEATATTAVLMTRGSAEPIPVFQVDHPFMFLVRENQTGSILFLGRVLDPS